MPKIQVQHVSQKNADEAMQILKDFFENDQDIRKVDSQIKCQFDLTQKKGQVQGSQFKAQVEVKPLNPGCNVAIMIDLPLLLTPFKGKVEEILKRKLAKHLT